MALILPLLSFLTGYWGVQYLKPIRPFLAALLARVLIPVLIIYNMVFYQEGSLWLIAFSFFCSCVFFALFYFILKNKLRALCLSYLNGAWLGIPFALAVFGPQVTSTVVALYIGGSLFGNVCAVMAVSEARQDTRYILKNVLFSPPVVALSMAALLSFWDLSHWQQVPWIEILYQANKVLVTFSGMCVLGMWLSNVRISRFDLMRSLQLIFCRGLFAVLLCGAAYFYLPIPQQTLTYAVMLMFFLLPPAANIVALETHYQGTGHSAKYIASGTLASAILIALYGVIVHALMPTL
jgi:malate permease and related proteins